MTIKSLITFDNSTWFKNKYEERINYYKNQIKNLTLHMQKTPYEKFYKLGDNETRLKWLEEDLEKLKNDPYTCCFWTRANAKEAYLKYEDVSLSKYYIMSYLGCSYGEMKGHLITLLNYFKEEEKLKVEIIKSFPPIYQYTKVEWLKSYNFDFLKFALDNYKQNEYINIEDLLNITDMTSSDLEKIKKMKKEFKFKKDENGNFIKKK